MSQCQNLHLSIYMDLISTWGKQTDGFSYNIDCVFQVNRIRHQNRINVHGTDIPDPISTFEELQKEYDLDPRIVQNIKAAGFQTPTPIQMQAVPLMMHV